MNKPTIEKEEIRTLKAFYDLMEQTRQVRVRLVEQVLSARTVEPGDLTSLRNALEALEGVPFAGGCFRLRLDAEMQMDVELDYEIGELRKDILYLERGESELLRHLASLHPGFDQHLQAGVALLAGKKFNCFITDRDGTINNYCGRYRSSVQSIYNAVFLTRFADTCCENPIIVTSAPLEDPGIVDVSVIPEKKFILAASKGREFIDLAGARRAFPIKPEKQDMLDRLNRKLKALVEQQDYQKFALIGSGLQLKFGQTTIARQDNRGSIPRKQSLAFKETITRMVQELDLQGRFFRIEDTGLDLEVILTIESAGEKLKDFDKADSVNYLADELGLELGRGPHLVCGDTASDTPMIEAVGARTRDTFAVFVTTEQELRARVEGVCANALTVPSPDVLVTILNALAQ